MGNNLGNKMANEQSLSLMEKSMKGNGKIGNEVTGQNITNKDCILNQNIICFFSKCSSTIYMIVLKMKNYIRFSNY